MAKLGAIPAARQGSPLFTIADMNDSPIVFWVDPGGTTGWSVMKVHPQALVDPEVKILENIEHWAHGQINSMDYADGWPREIFDGSGRLEYTDLGAEMMLAECRVAEEILEIFDMFPGAVMGIEDFIPQRLDKGRDFLSPVRITSMLDFGLSQRGFQSFRQMPSEATGTATNERLKSWGLYSSDGMVHARDADRHAIMWLRKCSVKKSLRAASWPHLYGEYEVRDKIASAREKTPVFKTARGPYYIPNGKTWADVEASMAS